MKLLTEDEREHLLIDLKAARKDLVRKLETMPISLKTLAVNQRKKGYEEKIKEIDEAIAKFEDKRTIYIELDSDDEDYGGGNQSTVPEDAEGEALAESQMSRQP